MKFSFLTGAALALALGVQAHAAPVLTNGGFETGDFTGWSVTANGIGGCGTDWNVSNLGIATQCLPVANPVEGQFAAYNSFDGAGPVNYTLKQSVALGSVSQASLSWQHAFEVNVFGLARTFSMSFLDSNDQLIGEVFSQSFENGTFGSQGWVANNMDVTALLAGYSGQTVQLVADVFISESFTGPAGFGLDAVDLDVVSVVPVPGALVLLLGGLGGLGALGARRKSA